MAGDPFAAAGFAPQQTQAVIATDPFGGAGFVAQPQTPASAPPERPPVISLGSGYSPYGIPSLGPSLDQAAVAGMPRASEKVAEGASFGLFPYIAAAGRYLMGTPWSQALQQSRDYTAQTSKDEPGVSAVLEGAGSVAPVGAAMHAAAPVLGAVERGVPYVGSALGQAILGGGLGAATAAGHDVGSGQTDNIGADVKSGATTGAVMGAAAPVVGQALQTVPNFGTAVVNAGKSVFGNAGRDAVAGQILREASGDFANTAARPPIADLQLRTAQATGNPGIASLERTLASEPGTQAGTAGEIVSNGRTPNQISALGKSLVGADASVEPAVLTNQASARGTAAIQNADTVLSKVEKSLWSDPAIKGVQVNGPTIASGVASDVAKFPASWRDAITGPQSKLGSFLSELKELGPNASIPDVNSVRSRLLSAARDAASGPSPDSVTAAAARGMASSLLDRLGSDPAIAGAPETTSQTAGYFTGRAIPGTETTTPAVPANPAAWAAYKTARDFSRQYHTTMGYPEFDSMLNPNSSGNIQANGETAFGRFFDVNGGTSTGLQRLQGVSDALRATKQPSAISAANELDQSAQQYLRAAIMKQGRAGAGLDATGAPAMNAASLATTVNKVAPAIGAAPMTAPIAGDVQAVGNAAELINRPSTLRGDTNSTTFEKLRNHDLVSAILGQTGSSALGAAAGGYAAGEYGPEDIPWYLRVPGGMLAGALLGQKFGPYAGKVVSHIPGAKVAVTGPTEDIMSRVWQGLADPAEYARLMGTMPTPPVSLTAPGVLSRNVPTIATGAIPAITSGRAGR